MKKGSKITLLVLMFLIIKEIWKMKRMSGNDDWSMGRSKKCGHRGW